MRRAAVSPVARASNPRPSRRCSSSSSATHSWSSGVLASRCRCSQPPTMTTSSPGSVGTSTAAGFGTSSSISRRQRRADRSRRRPGRRRIARDRRRRSRGGAQRLPQGARRGIRRTRRSTTNSSCRCECGRRSGGLRGHDVRRPHPSLRESANAARAEFLTAARQSVPIGSIRPLRGTRPHELLQSLVELLAAAGIEPYAVDITPSDVASLGLCVVRAIAPELCPLDVRQDACFLGAARLRRAPVVLRFHGRALELDELNLDPHPFP